MVSNELAAPNTRKTEVIGRDYPQGKQRKETALGEKVANSGRSGEMPPAALLARTPRGVGILRTRKRARRLSEPFNLVGG